MSLALALWLMLFLGLLGYLAGHIHGWRQGQLEAVRRVERDLAPLLLEELLEQSAKRSQISAEQTDALERYRKAGLN